MKVEYDYFLDSPSLIIKGTDFIKALSNDRDLYLLEIAVKGFGDMFGVVSHFDKRVNDELNQWVTKSGEIIYTIKERWIGRYVSDTWCEVYVSNAGRPIQIVFSDDYGRNFELRNKEVKTDE